MSGPIRKMIGPAKAHLQQYVESTNSLLENKPREPELDEYKSEEEDFLSKLTTNVSLLENATKTGHHKQLHNLAHFFNKSISLFHMDF